AVILAALTSAADAAATKLPSAMLGHWCVASISVDIKSEVHKRVKQKRPSYPNDAECMVLRSNEEVGWEHGCKFVSVGRDGKSYIVKSKCRGTEERWEKTDKYELKGDRLVVTNIEATDPVGDDEETQFARSSRSCREDSAVSFNFPGPLIRIR